MPTYTDREAGLADALERIRRRSETDAVPMIVLVAGGSASGKTSAVAKRIATTFGEDAVIVSMDDYYRGRSYMDKEATLGHVLNFDQPEAVEMESVRKDILSLKSGTSVPERRYAFATGTGHYTGTSVEPKRVVVVEGLFALREEIRDLGDLGIFVDVDTHSQLIRRLLRDTIERATMTLKDMLAYFADTVVPMHERYILSTRETADIVIRNDYIASEESKRAVTSERQIKYRTQTELRYKIGRTGAEPLGRLRQVDRYYDPPGRPLALTGESLRIREEAGTITLCYKGPDTGMGNGIRRRPKLEFEIDQKTKRAFLGVYGWNGKTVWKTRDLYRKESLVFSIDTVSSEEDGRTRTLGTFLEFRLTGEGEGEENAKMEALLDTLDIDKTTKTSLAYIEMW